MFTQPANNSVQGARPYSIHHTHDQVERDEMSGPIAAHFESLNESHSPSIQTKWPVRAGRCYPNSSHKERLILTPYSLIVHMETLHSVTGFSMNGVRRLGPYTQTSLRYGPCVTACACVYVG